MPVTPLELANRIELHLQLDTPGLGYPLSEADQQTIIRCLRHASQTPRQLFESILAGLNYDGPDLDSLTVGEIRRALP